MFGIGSVLAGALGFLCGVELVACGLTRLRDHPQPVRRHLEPHPLVVQIAGSPSHPLALGGIGAIFVVLAHRRQNYQRARRFRVSGPPAKPPRRMEPVEVSRAGR